jgi:hypothetical protein
MLKTTVSFKGAVTFHRPLYKNAAEVTVLIAALKALGVEFEGDKVYLTHENPDGFSTWETINLTGSAPESEKA